MLQPGEERRYDIESTFWSAARVGNDERGKMMGFDQYHEPANELVEETRTFARMIASLTEEAEAINWYQQRISVEKDADAQAIMADAQEEEFKHFGMDLEFLLRRTPKWRAALQNILFQEGDIVALARRAKRPRTKRANPTRSIRAARTAGGPPASAGNYEPTWGYAPHSQRSQCGTHSPTVLTYPG